MKNLLVSCVAAAPVSSCLRNLFATQPSCSLYTAKPTPPDRPQTKKPARVTA
jgi:hypothetical protein